MTPLEIFYRDCIKDLKRIAGETRGDASIDDLKNEAWIIARRLEVKGSPLDLSSPDGQDSMLGKLYGKFVMPMKTCIGFALRLDKDWDKSDEDAGPRLGDTVAGPELSDPARALEERETPTALEASRLRSYSQATAYAICLHRWPDAGSLAAYLAITLETLNAKVRYWKLWIGHQPSLFDGIEQISHDFTPRRGALVLPRIDFHCDDQQQAWAF